LIHIIGIIDDFRSQKAIIKLLVQIIAACIVAFNGFLIQTIKIPYLGSITLGLFAYPVTIFWIIAITNAINLVDGMDGLAGGIGAFASASMGIIALMSNQVGAALSSFALFGAIIAFLVFNLPPARIFMGDSGSLLLGFVLSVIPLLGISKAASFTTVIVPVTLLIVPILDTIVAIIRRIKAKRTIMSPDKDHLHHKLLEMGFSEKKILVLIYSVCFYLSIIAITSTIVPKESNIYVILTVWFGSMMGYALIHYMNAKKIVLPLSTKAERKNSA
jgi:UDP-GlcNAc:undecaprenyl-phosphate GlcNAc-1-phosphate transferase